MEERPGSAAHEPPTSPLPKFKPQTPKLAESQHVIGSLQVSQLDEINIEDFANAAKLVSLLRKDDLAVRRDVLWVFWKLTQKDACKKELRKLGILDPLIDCLDTDSNEVRRYALRTLCNMSFDDSHNSDIRQLGGIAPIIDCLYPIDGAEDLETTRAALRTLCNISIEAANKVEIRLLGGLGPIVDCLFSTDVKTRRDALRTLCNLCIDAGNKSEVRPLGGLKPIIECVGGEDQESTRYALACLINLSNDTVNENEIRRMSGLAPITRCLGSDDGEIRGFALRCLCNLSINNANKTEMYEMGLLDVLQKQLSPTATSQADVEVVCYALATLMQLCLDKTIRDAAGSPDLLSAVMDCAKSDDANMRRYGLGAWSALVHSREHQSVGCNSGLLDLALQAVTCEDAKTVKYAARCLSQLLRHSETNVETARKAGIVATTVALLDNKDQEVKIAAQEMLVGIAMHSKTARKTLRGMKKTAVPKTYAALLKDAEKEREGEAASILAACEKQQTQLEEQREERRQEKERARKAEDERRAESRPVTRGTRLTTAPDGQTRARAISMSMEQEKLREELKSAQRRVQFLESERGTLRASTALSPVNEADKVDGLRHDLTQSLQQNLELRQELERVRSITPAAAGDASATAAVRRLAGHEAKMISAFERAASALMAAASGDSDSDKARKAEAEDLQRHVAEHHAQHEASVRMLLDDLAASRPMTAGRPTTADSEVQRITAESVRDELTKLLEQERALRQASEERADALAAKLANASSNLADAKLSGEAERRINEVQHALDQRSSKAAEDISQFKSVIGDLERRLADAEKQHAERASEMKSYAEKSDQEKHALLKQMQAEQATYTATIDKLSELQASVANNAELERRYTEAQGKISELQVLVQAGSGQDHAHVLQEHASALQEKLNEALAQERADGKAAAARLADVSGSLASAMQQMEALRQELSSSEKQRIGAEREIDSLKQELASRERTESDVQRAERIAELEAKLAETQRSNADSMQTMQGKLAELEAALANGGPVEADPEPLELAEKRIAELEATVATRDTTNASLQQQLQDAEARASQMRSEVEAAATAAQELRESGDGSSAIVADYETKIKHLSEELARQDDAWRAAEKQIAELQAQVSKQAGGDDGGDSNKDTDTAAAAAAAPEGESTAPPPSDSEMLRELEHLRAALAEAEASEQAAAERTLLLNSELQAIQKTHEKEQAELHAKLQDLQQQASGNSSEMPAFVAADTVTVNAAGTVAPAVDVHQLVAESESATKRIKTLEAELKEQGMFMARELAHKDRLLAQLKVEAKEKEQELARLRDGSDGAAGSSGGAEAEAAAQIKELQAELKTAFTKVQTLQNELTGRDEWVAQETRSLEQRAAQAERQAHDATMRSEERAEQMAAAAKAEREALQGQMKQLEHEMRVLRAQHQQQLTDAQTRMPVPKRKVSGGAAGFAAPIGARVSTRSLARFNAAPLERVINELVECESVSRDADLLGQLQDIAAESQEARLQMVRRGVFAVLVPRIGANAPSIASHRKSLELMRRLTLEDAAEVDFVKTPNALSRLTESLGNTDDAHVRFTALSVLRNVSANDATEKAILAHDVFSPLIPLAQHSSTPVRRDATKTIRNLSFSAAGREVLRSKDVVKVLLDTVRADTDSETVQYAMRALAVLSVSASVRADMRHSPGGVAAIVDVARRDATSPVTQRNAVGALINLSVSSKNKETIRQAGGVATLVSCLASSDADTKQYAARALANLCVNDAVKNEMLVHDTAVLRAVSLAGSRGTDVMAQRYAMRVVGALLQADHGLDAMNGGKCDAVQAIIACLCSSDALTVREAVRALPLVWSDALATRLIAAPPAVAGVMSIFSGPDHAPASRAPSAANTPTMTPSASRASLSSNVSSISAKGSDNARAIAVNVLAQLSDNKQALNLLMSGDLLAHLLSALQQPTDSVYEVQRCAAFILANLTRQEAIREKVLELDGLATILTCLSQQQPEEQATDSRGPTPISRTTTPMLFTRRRPSGESVIAAAAVAATSRGCVVELLNTLFHLATIASARIAVGTLNGLPHVLRWLDPQLAHLNLAQRAAITALYALSMDDENDVAIARLNGIPHVLDALTSSDDVLVRKATSVLCNLSINYDNKRRIHKAGGVPLLVALLNNADAKVQRDATRALRNLCFDADCKHAVHQEGGIPRIVELAGGDDRATVRYATRALGILSTEATLREDINSAGGLAVLLRLLASDDVDTRRSAIGAVINLSISQKNKLQVRKLGALPDVLACLKSVDSETVLYGLRAIGNLALLPENEAEIIQLGGLATVLSFLDVQDMEARRTALATLTNMTISPESINAVRIGNGVPLLVKCAGSSDAAVRREALRALANVVLNVENQLAMAQAESGVAVVAAALTMADVPTRRDAVQILAALASNTGLTEQVATMTIITQLVAATRSSDLETRRAAVTALHNLGAADATVRAAVDKAVASIGGLPDPEDLVPAQPATQTSVAEDLAAGAVASDEPDDEGNGEEEDEDEEHQPAVDSVDDTDAADAAAALQESHEDALEEAEAEGDAADSALAGVSEEEEPQPAAEAEDQAAEAPVQTPAESPEAEAEATQDEQQAEQAAEPSEVKAEEEDDEAAQLAQALEETQAQLDAIASQGEELMQNQAALTEALEADADGSAKLSDEDRTAYTNSLAQVNEAITQLAESQEAYQTHMNRLVEYAQAMEVQAAEQPDVPGAVPEEQ